MKLIAGFLLLNIGAYCSHLYYELHPEVDLMYDVHILEKYDDYNFRADVADGEGARHEFALVFCPDYQVSSEIQSGTTLAYLAYARDRHSKCYEVGRPQYGYGIERRNNAPVIRPSNPRQAAASVEGERP